MKVMLWIKKLTFNTFTKDSIKQIEAVFNWLGNVIKEDDLICVNVDNRQFFFNFEFPIKFGDRPKLIQNPAQEPTFIIIMQLSLATRDKAEMIKIFSGPEIEVYEKRKSIEKILPLYYGLASNEKIIALKVTRDALEKFLRNGSKLGQEYFQSLPTRFYLKTDLNVALWVRGVLRGSAVVENRHLSEGIADAVVAAAEDIRFKPITADEMEDLRISITTMSDLRVPLTSYEIEQNKIYPEKGYLIRQNDKYTWFLPEIFNLRRLHKLAGLYELWKEKVSDSLKLKDADTFIFEVQEFMESAKHRIPLTLHGPLVKYDHEISNDRIVQNFRAAAEWLCHIQDLDGNFPPIINPISGHRTQIDWPRSALTAWALAEFGKIIREKKYIKVAEKNFYYLSKYLKHRPSFARKVHILSYVFWGQLANSLGFYNETLLAAQIVSTRIKQLQFEPIAFSNTTSFLLELSERNGEFLNLSKKLATLIKEEFEKEAASRRPVNLASWAELINVYYLLSKISKNNEDYKFFDRINAWFKKQQLPTGAFPETTISDFVYTRGTGKIFEILSVQPEKNHEAIIRALHWLFQMQYNEESVYFIQPAILPEILGGFRHDYFNQEAWIDAAGHILLGASRLIQKQKFFDENIVKKTKR